MNAPPSGNKEESLKIKSLCWRGAFFISKEASGAQIGHIGQKVCPICASIGSTKGRQL